jgi:SSS family solute:Na+ symporter
MVAGFITAIVLELAYPGYLPWAYGLTSGAVGLAVNLAIYVAVAYLIPQSREEQRRVEDLFALVEERRSAALGTSQAAPQPV